MNSKKRILFSLTYYEPNISGVTIYVKRLAEGMAKMGHRVTILSSWYKKEFPKCEEKGGIKILREKVHFRLGKGVFMLGLPVTVWRETKKHDVINCHLPQFESFVFAIIAKIQRKKLILTYHADLWGLNGIINFFSQLFTNIFQLITGFLADKIIAYTADYAHHSFFLRFFGRKVTTIYPPVTVSPPSPSYIREIKRKVSGIKFKIGYSGRIAQEKGISFLLETIPYLKKRTESFKIIFAGPFKEVIGDNFLKKIEGKIEKYKDNLLFLGPLDQEKLASFYQKIDVLVLSSQVESFGLVQVEAMLNGCPVVVSDLPGVREPVLMTGGGRLTPVGNPKKLAKNIMAVLERRREYSRKALRAREIFAYQKTLDQYEAIFNS